LAAINALETEKYEIKSKLIIFDGGLNKSPAEMKTPPVEEETTGTSGVLQFTKTEISKMPKKFQKIIIINGDAVCYRKRRDDRYNCSCEIRLRRGGYDISASAPTLKEAKVKFLDKLKNYDKKRASETAKIPKTFDAFSKYYFENFRKRKTAERTYKNDVHRYNKYLLPAFGDMPLKDITAGQCQTLLDGITAEGKGKTCDEAHSLLRQIFNMAIRHGIITHNPIDIVFHKKHETEHGSALTKDEESALLAAVEGTPYHLMFAVALYTGLRPNEFKTAVIEGDFVTAVNSKQKDGKVHYKKIPVSPMLRAYFDRYGITELKFYTLHRIEEKFRAVMPNHKLYDLRTTFYTRCMECGVSEVAREKFMGHTLKGLQEVYTDLSDEYLLTEAQKLRY